MVRGWIFRITGESDDGPWFFCRTDRMVPNCVERHVAIKSFSDGIYSTNL